MATTDLTPRRAPGVAAPGTGARLARGGVLVLLRTTGLVGGVLVGFLVLLWVVTLFVPPAASSLGNSLAVDVQVPDDVALAELDQTSTVYAADGSVIAVLHDEVNRTVVPLSSVPAHVQHAVIAAEDRRFYEHDGYDVEGIGRALVANAQAGGTVQGGSTITQQLAKSEVGDDLSLQRKLSELAYAIALERELTKDEILERYLNQVYFGGGAYGIAAAAQEYFGIDVGELTPDQAALLAGLIRSPSSSDPRRFPDVAKTRRDQILEGMVELGYLEAGELDRWLDRDTDVLPPRDVRPRDPYIAEAVKQEFYANPAFGATRLERNERLLNGGLEIYTSFDPALQALAREVVQQYFPNAAPTAALASVDPRTGQIRAIFGGSDFDTEQFNFATQGRRQPGSSFKPFVMATALEIGFSPGLFLPGSSPAKFPTGDEWETRGVSNYGGASYGRVTMREALIRSVNTAFAQLMLIVGPENAVETARQMGIDMDAATANIINPAIALGGLERGVTPLEMASAFGTFALAGAHVQPALIDRVQDADGNVVYERDSTPTQVLDPDVNAVMVDTMQSVVCCGTGRRAQLSGGWRPAGKTGTAQGNADAWFVGYTPVLSTAVWTGHPEARISMPGATGGNLPARVWHDFMLRALEGVEPVDFPTESVAPARVAAEGEAEVPDVRGLTELQGLAELADENLAGLATVVANTAPAGQIVWQSPRAGTVVAESSTVRIGVSSGRPPPQPTVAPVPSAAPTGPEATSTEATPPALPSPGPAGPPRPSASPHPPPSPSPQPPPQPPASPAPGPTQPPPDATTPPDPPEPPEPPPKPSPPTAA